MEPSPRSFERTQSQPALRFGPVMPPPVVFKDEPSSPNAHIALGNINQQQSGRPQNLSRSATTTFSLPVQQQQQQQHQQTAAAAADDDEREEHYQNYSFQQFVWAIEEAINSLRLVADELEKALFGYYRGMAQLASSSLQRL